jgi:hypothetical protein
MMTDLRRRQLIEHMEHLLRTSTQNRSRSASLAYDPIALYLGLWVWDRLSSSSVRDEGRAVSQIWNGNCQR